MRRHSFDPMSAVLGVIAVVAGLFVAVGEAVDLDVNWAWLITAAAVLIGLAIIPWQRRAPSPAAEHAELLEHSVGVPVLADRADPIAEELGDRDAVQRDPDA